MFNSPKACKSQKEQETHAFEPAFKPDEVVNLWRHQFGPWNEDPLSPGYAPRRHPFTCANRASHPQLAGDKGVLVPTVRGWICPFCDYTQNWAHPQMKAGVRRAEGC